MTSLVCAVNGFPPFPRHESIVFELKNQRTLTSSKFVVIGGWCRGGCNGTERDEYFMDYYTLDIRLSTDFFLMGEKKFDLFWNEITTVGNKPSNRGGFSAILKQDTVICFGGGTLWTNGEVKDDTFQLNLESKAWDIIETSGKRPSPRQGHQSVLCDNGCDMLIIGGTDNFSNFTDINVLDTATWTWSHIRSNIPNNTHQGLGISYSGIDRYGPSQYILFGGSTWVQLVSEISDSTFILETCMTGERSVLIEKICDNSTTPTHTSSSSSTCATPPKERFLHASCVVQTDHLNSSLKDPVYFKKKGKLLIQGGWGFKPAQDNTDMQEADQSIYFSDCKILDLDTSTWAECDAVGRAIGSRFAHKITHLPHLGVLVVMLGHTGMVPLNSVQVIDYPLLDTQPSSGLHVSADEEKNGGRGGSDELGERKHRNMFLYSPPSLSTQMVDSFKQGLFTDVAFSLAIPSPRLIAAHKFLLGSVSDVFKSLFLSSFQENSDNVVHISDVDSNLFYDFLLCLYGDDINRVLNSENILEILELADRYHCSLLKYSIERLLSLQANEDNVCSLRSYACLYSCPYLIQRCDIVLQQITCNLTS